MVSIGDTLLALSIYTLGLILGMLIEGLDYRYTHTEPALSASPAGQHRLLYLGSTDP